MAISFASFWLPRIRPETRGKCGIVRKPRKYVAFYTLLPFPGGCCNQKDGSITCPIGEPDHENNEVYELYRAKCETDDCNTMDPR